MGRMPDNIVISPGPGRPDVPTDFGMCAQALREATEVPILGVCLGHEGMGIAHGAKVIHACEPMHGRLSPIFHDGDLLFRGVPQGARVVRYHSLVVDAATMPARGPLKPTAWTGDGVLMAMRHNEYPHWGVQFHPESVGTRHGSDIMQNFRDVTVGWRRTHGQGTSKGGVRRRHTGALNGMVRNGCAGAVNLGVRDAPSIARAFPAGKIATKTVALTEKATNTPAIPPSRGSPRHSTAKQRSFVVRVQEVAMTGAQGGGDGDSAGERTALPASMPDTELVFRALYGDEPTAWWLDSSSQRPGLAVDGQAKARFTFMGGADGPLSEVIECYGGDRLVINGGGGGGGKGGSGAAGKGERQEVHANILDYLKAEMAKMGRAQGATSDDALEVRLLRGIGAGAGEFDSGVRRDDGDETSSGRAALPFDFLGGFVGFLGYELRHEANDVLRRSVGGTEWHWPPPSGGQWSDLSFESKATGGAEAAAAASATKTASSGRDAEGTQDGDGDVPLGFLVFVDRFVAFDHEEGKAYVLALAEKPPCTDGELDVASGNKMGHGPAGAMADPGAEALEWIRVTAEYLRSISFGGALEGTAEPGEPQVAPPLTNGPAVVGQDRATTPCAMDTHRSRYERNLNEIMRLVGEGETYEVCLTNQIVCERPGGALTPPLDLYSRLRRSNPAPYAAYIVHDPHRRLSRGAGSGRSAEGPGSAFAVCCSSPERFLKVDGHGWAESKPIKGTVKRYVGVWIPGRFGLVFVRRPCFGR